VSVKRPRLVLVLVVALNVLALAPALGCGYTGDDVLNSLMPGYLAETGHSAWTQLRDEVHVWAAHGRFYPLAFYYILLFTAVRSLWAYRLLQLAVAVLNLLLFARLVAAWTGSQRLGLLAAVLPSALVQLRIGPDPVLGFHCLPQVVFASLAGSLLCLDSYLRTRRRWLFAGSVLCYLLGLLTYDITYPFFLLHAALIWFRGAGRATLAVRAKQLAPFALLSTTFIVLCVALRVAYGVGLSGNGPPNPDVYAQPPAMRGWPTALAKQTVSAVPLSYLALFLAQRGLVTVGELLAQCSAGVVLSALGGMALVRFLLRKPEEAEATAGSGLGPRALLVLGGLMTVLPGVLMALAPKYQRELEWGIGYIPVYVSSFGVATVLVAFCRLLLKLAPVHRRLYAGLVTAGAVLFAATWAVHGAANTWVVDYVNSLDHYSRSLLENGVKHGLFWGVPDGSRLVVAGRPDYCVAAGYSYFFRTHTGRHLDVGARGSYPAESPGAAPVYFLRYGASSAAAGYVLLGKCDQLAATREEVRSAVTGQAYLYVQVPDPWRRFSVGGKWAAGDAFVLSDRELPLVGQGRAWRLYRLPFGDHPADLASLTVDMDRGR
jgi:hypothetical protein